MVGVMHKPILKPMVLLKPRRIPTRKIRVVEIQKALFITNASVWAVVVVESARKATKRIGGQVAKP
jgi:hypothetical protein